MSTTLSRTAADTRHAEADGDTLRAMFERMALARAVDRLLQKQYREHPMSGWWHPGEGAEGAPIGACAALRPRDQVFYQGRGAAWAIGKGMPIDPILGDIFGRTTGATRGKGGGTPHWHDHAVGVMGESGVLGSVFTLAVGAALAHTIRGRDIVTLANFGDGTSARGTFHEAMVHAVTWKLPVIFLCENNGWMVNTRIEEVAPSADVSNYARGYGIPGVIVDGQDAVAVRDVTLEACARARRGDGPTLIECKVARRLGHFAGDPEVYRPRDELAAYRDPLDVLGARLDARFVESTLRASDAAAEAALARTMSAPLAGDDALHSHLYFG